MTAKRKPTKGDKTDTGSDSITTNPVSPPADDEEPAASSSSARALDRDQPLPKRRPGESTAPQALSRT